jgi:anthranilate phosphoribosyltransferase
MIKEAIQSAVDGQDLSQAEAQSVMHEIMSGEASPAQIGALATALRIKGETAEELLGFAGVMREKATRVAHSQGEVVDTCGTGGDKSGSFNISTTAAFVVAGAGAKVAKHGNRAMSSRSGSADLLEALGVRTDLEPEAMGRCIDQAGIGFLFAQALHPALKHAALPRREIGIRTFFNLLGPLSNPAGARRQVLGVFDPDYCEKLAWVLGKLGSTHVLVVAGLDGLDEISTTDESLVAEYREGKVRSFHVSPEEYGLPKASLEDLKGGDAAKNAEISRAVLGGEKGFKRDIVLLNASAGLVAAGLCTSLREGMVLAAKSLDSGEALGKLGKLAELSQSLAGAKARA